MPTFPYTRAALVLAESRYFGVKASCQKYRVPSSTYRDWKRRLETDDKLMTLYKNTAKELRNQWQESSVQTLNQAYLVIQEGLKHHPFRNSAKDPMEAQAWAKSMASLATMIKSMGDLAVSVDVLKEDEEQLNDFEDLLND